MIGWSHLKGAARALPANRQMEGVPKRLANRRLKLGDVRRRFAWPSGNELDAALAHASSALSEGGDLELLIDILCAPLRAYVLRADAGVERYALLGSYEGGLIRWCEVTWLPDLPMGSRLRLELHSLPPEAPGLADALQSLYAAIDPDHRPRTDHGRRSNDRALWVGGSPGEAGEDDWEHLLAGLFASRDLDLDVYVRPGDAPLDQAIRTVERFRGVTTFVWEPCAGDATRRAHLCRVAKRNVLITERDFELALVEAAVALDGRDQARAEETHDDAATSAGVQIGALVGGPYYFKKTGAGGGSQGDRMQLMSGPCVHDNSWRRARRPDQAKRGIARIAGVAPKKLQHCARCTGGGFWRAWFPPQNESGDLEPEDAEPA